MVNAEDIMDTHPLERMDKLGDIRDEKKKTLASKRKELEELEIRKRQEIEELDNRKRKELEELDSKKKELAELEKKKAKEIEETEDLIETSFQDLMRHKMMLISKEEEFIKKNSEKNLEDMTVNAPNLLPQNMEYGKFFEKLEVPERLYDVANKDFYNNLNALKNKASAGKLTPNDMTFVEQLKERIENFNQPGYLNNRDDHNYVQRSKKVLEEIDVSLAYK